MPVPGFGKLFVALTEPIVPLLKASFPGFIAIENADLQPLRTASENNIVYIFFMLPYLINNEPKACPDDFRQPLHSKSM
jgi:hypothetical protein